MVLKGRPAGVGFFKAFLILMVVLFSVSAQAAVLYKNYIIRKCEGQDILCDPYVVQKDDYVLKIFRQRGEISQTDFPEFLKIFQAINPQVQNIDKILPGQQIFIPLKKLDPASVPDQAFGVVTIPFVTNMDIEEILKDHADVYEVKAGDTVSELLSTYFGRYGTEAYKKGLSIFKVINPQVEDVNLILVGEQLRLPRKALQNELWYDSLFDADGNVAPRSIPEKTDEAEAKTTAEGQETAGTSEAASPLADAARILDAKIYQRGTYYFPRSGRSDFQLDLKKYPVLETGDGARVLISTRGRKELSDEELSVLKTFWKNLVVANFPPDPSLPQVLDAVTGSLTGGSVPGKRTFTQGGIEVTVQSNWLLDEPKRGETLAVSTIAGTEEKTPQSVVDYLKTFGLVLKEVVLSNTPNLSEPEADTTISYGQVPVLDASVDRQLFVRNFFGILDMTYQQNVTVSFGYAGIQIQAVTNALNRPDGLLVLLDFGDLQGEAIATLEKAGFKVFQVSPGEGMEDLIQTLLSAAGMTCERAPTFTAAERSGPNNTRITLPGFLGRKDGVPQVLLATVPVPDDLVRFFIEKKIEAVALTNVSDG